MENKKLIVVDSVHNLELCRNRFNSEEFIVKKVGDSITGSAFSEVINLCSSLNTELYEVWFVYVNAHIRQPNDKSRQIILDELIKTAEPLIKLLNDKGYPHMEVIVTTTGATLLEGICSDQKFMKYVKD